MSVLSREDYLTRIKGRLGDDLSDDDISLIEDMTDTYDDMSNRIKDNTDWKSKYEENDKSWRQKYVDRFNGKVESDSDFIDYSTKKDNESMDVYEAPKTYADLFTVGD